MPKLPWAETKVKEEEIIAWRPLPEPYMDSGTKMDKELEQRHFPDTA